MCASSKEILLSVKKDTELLRSGLGALKGDAASGKGEDKSGTRKMKTRLKLVETALQELSEVHDGTMKQVMFAKNCSRRSGKRCNQS